MTEYDVVEIRLFLGWEWMELVQAGVRSRA